jgi:hypothetical protein
VLRLEDIGQEADFWGRSKLRTKESKKALVVEKLGCFLNYASV